MDKKERKSEKGRKERGKPKIKEGRKEGNKKERQEN